jgi:CheY-like chemotaxis protein
MPKDEKRILIVDDDDAIRTLLVTILKRRGMPVDTAKNGAEALKKLESCSYVLMLLDLMMPVVSGWQVLEHLANVEQARRPLIILLTAGTEPRDFNPELVIGTVRKPFDVELLDDMITGCVSMVNSRSQPDSCPPSETEENARPTKTN